jgi:hypothetical protein
MLVDQGGSHTRVAHAPVNSRLLAPTPRQNGSGVPQIVEVEISRHPLARRRFGPLT